MLRCSGYAAAFFFLMFSPCLLPCYQRLRCRLFRCRRYAIAFAITLIIAATPCHAAMLRHDIRCRDAIRYAMRQRFRC